MNPKEFLIGLGGDRVKRSQERIDRFEETLDEGGTLSTQQGKNLAQDRRIVRRHFMKLGLEAGGVVALSAVGLGYLLSKDGENTGGDIEGAGINLDKSPDQFTQEDFLKVGSLAIDNYQRVLGVELDKQAVLDSIIFVPNLSTLSEEERKDICSKFPCEEAAGYNSRTTNKIYFQKDHFDQQYRRTKAAYPDVDQGVINLAIITSMQQAVLHELTHYSARVYSFSGGELDDLIRKHIGEITPVIRDRGLYLPNFIDGAFVDYKRTNNPEAGARAFGGLEEAIAITTELYVSNAVVSDKRLILTIDYFAVQRQLFTDLLGKLSPNNYGEAIKTVIKLRSEEYGLEKLISLVGQKFETDPAKQFERGFIILFAVDQGRPDLYRRALTTP